MNLLKRRSESSRKSQVPQEICDLHDEALKNLVDSIKTSLNTLEKEKNKYSPDATDRGLLAIEEEIACNKEILQKALAEQARREQRGFEK